MKLKSIPIFLFLAINLYGDVLTSYNMQILPFLTSIHIQISTKSLSAVSIIGYKPYNTSFGVNEEITTNIATLLKFHFASETPKLSSCTVFPQQAPPGEFVFSCIYLDEDPPASGYPKVKIFKEDSEILGSPFTLNYVSGNLQQGILFSTTVVLNYASDKYKFCFYAEDIYGFSVQSPYIDGPIVNNPPILTFYHDENFKNGINPILGSDLTTFYFRVVYTDTDNHPPAVNFPKLYILKDNTTAYVLTMNYLVGAYNLGAHYLTSVSLPVGKYQYYFVACDVLGSQSNILSSTGPIVNRNCEIEVTHYTKEIEPNEDFVVYLKYIDIDADPPDSGYPEIVFYLNNELIHTGVMEYVQGSFGTGAVYVYSVKFSTVSANYSFVCYAKDNTGLWPVVQTTTNGFVVSTLPSKPVNLTIYQDNNYNVSVSGKVTLKWNSTDSDPNSSIVYQLYFGDSLNHMKKIYEGPDTEYTIYSLEDDKVYYWYVVAVDDTSRKSQSEIFSFNTISKNNEDKIFNYPNPVNAKKQQKTNIVFYSDTDSSCEIYICTLFGEIVFKDTIQVYKGSNVYEYTPQKELKSGSYAVVVKIGNKIKKGHILVLNK
ncbi:MAG: hypothetical protein QXG39_05665 [Candidatus Aenigmatarchaeota archaeon]